jgi:hypothetical protein
LIINKKSIKIRVTNVPGFVLDCPGLKGSVQGIIEIICRKYISVQGKNEKIPIIQDFLEI